MVIYPNAKINLGLNIVEKRPDGYHNLETVFYPIPLHDTLEIRPTEGKEGDYRFIQSGKTIEGNSEDNLVIRALRLLQQEGYTFPFLEIRLEKQIPSGAGLGGGSADAAFMLRALNDIFNLHIPATRLEEYAACLGADCAVFIRNCPVYAEGIGNLFTPITLSLQGYWLVVVKPDIFISTGKAFSQIRPARPARNLLQIIETPVDNWKTEMMNDFEGSVFPQFPELGHLKQQLYDCGALYAAMSGSGSSLFGLFAQPPQNIEVHFPGCYFRQMKLA